MKVVAVNGSPRKAGNTARMLKEIANQAQQRGAEIKYFDLVDMHIEDCKACKQCKRTDTCSQKDDMNIIKEEMKDADLLILGSPIYMGAETGMMKCFIDRLYGFMLPTKEAGDFESRLEKGKKAIVLFTCGLSDGDKVYNYIKVRYFDLLIKHLRFDDLRTFIVGGANPSEDLRESVQAKDVLSDTEVFFSSE
jgi:multimeric flavodoxin WrbA